MSPFIQVINEYLLPDTIGVTLCDKKDGKIIMLPLVLGGPCGVQMVAIFVLNAYAVTACGRQ